MASSTLLGMNDIGFAERRHSAFQINFPADAVVNETSRNSEHTFSSTNGDTPPPENGFSDGHSTPNSLKRQRVGSHSGEIIIGGGTRGTPSNDRSKQLRLPLSSCSKSQEVTSKLVGAVPIMSDQVNDTWLQHAPSLDNKVSVKRSRKPPQSATLRLTVSLLKTYKRSSATFRYDRSLNPRRALTKECRPADNGGVDNAASDLILHVNDTLKPGNCDMVYNVVDLLGQGTFGQVVRCNVKISRRRKPQRTGASGNAKADSAMHSSIERKGNNEMEEEDEEELDDYDHDDDEDDKCDGADLRQVAVKVIKNKPAYYNQALVEIRILTLLNQHSQVNDSARKHIVRLIDSFVHRGHLCLVFELLAINLYELIKQNNFRGLKMSFVKSFSKQILEALQALAKLGIVHCDLKPENILLQGADNNNPRIKVIDFGSACYDNQTMYTYIQSRFYRAPEVILELPYDNGIDMWSMGCITMEIFFGLPLFPGVSEHNQLSRIIELLGYPPDQMVESGKAAAKFFNTAKPTGYLSSNAHLSAALLSPSQAEIKRSASLPVEQLNQRKAHHVFDRRRVAHQSERWVLKSAVEWARDRNLPKPEVTKRYLKEQSLYEAVVRCTHRVMPRSGRHGVEAEREDRMAILDFVSGLLGIDPRQRWTAEQAALHPFLTGEPMTKPYVPVVCDEEGTSTAITCLAGVPHISASTTPTTSTSSVDVCEEVAKRQSQQAQREEVESKVHMSASTLSAMAAVSVLNASLPSSSSSSSGTSASAFVAASGGGSRGPKSGTGSVEVFVSSSAAASSSASGGTGGARSSRSSSPSRSPTTSPSMSSAAAQHRRLSLNVQSSPFVSAASAAAFGFNSASNASSLFPMGPFSLGSTSGNTVAFSPRNMMPFSPPSRPVHPYPLAHATQWTATRAGLFGGGMDMGGANSMGMMMNGPVPPPALVLDEHQYAVPHNNISNLPFNVPFSPRHRQQQFQQQQELQLNSLGGDSQRNMLVAQQQQQVMKDMSGVSHAHLRRHSIADPHDAMLPDDGIINFGSSLPTQYSSNNLHHTASIYGLGTMPQMAEEYVVHTNPSSAATVQQYNQFLQQQHNQQQQQQGQQQQQQFSQMSPMHCADYATMHKWAAHNPWSIAGHQQQHLSRHSSQPVMVSRGIQSNNNRNRSGSGSGNSHGAQFEMEEASPVIEEFVAPSSNNNNNNKLDDNKPIFDGAGGLLPITTINGGHAAPQEQRHQLHLRAAAQRLAAHAGRPRGQSESFVSDFLSSSASSASLSSASSAASAVSNLGGLTQAQRAAAGGGGYGFNGMRQAPSLPQTLHISQLGVGGGNGGYMPLSPCGGGTPSSSSTTESVYAWPPSPGMTQLQLQLQQQHLVQQQQQQQQQFLQPSLPASFAGGGQTPRTGGGSGGQGSFFGTQAPLSPSTHGKPEQDQRQ